MRDEQRSIRWPGQKPTATSKPATAGTKKGWPMVLGLMVTIAGLIAVAIAVIGVGGGEAVALARIEAQEPVFAPLAEEGPDAFFPLAVQMEILEEETGQDIAPGAAATGLFGGTAENTCDPQRLIDYLMANPDKGRAWAAVQGIDFQDIPAYVNGLSVRVLAAPIDVLNHGFDAETGNPYEIPTTLEAGTAVLVDANGDIRTRCYCGNPVKPMPVAHKPPRCVVVPALVYTEPAGDQPVAGVPMNVVLTGMGSVDGTWTEIQWGPGAPQTGWTQTVNLSKHICLDTTPVIQPAPTVPPATEPTEPPVTEPTEPPVTEPTEPPMPEPTEPPAPTPAPQPTPRPTEPPRPEPTPAPQPTPTPGFIQPFQPYCSISKKTIEVGETTQFSGSHVPDSVQVTWSFDHGDGTIDRANPSNAFYHHPGTYTVTGLADVGGDVRQVPCGTVTVTPKAVEAVFYCNISATRILEGATTTFTGSTDPHDLPVTWVFDHGDGYREQANPSVSLYPHAGFYDVTAEATYQGHTTTIHCGTVEVIQDTRPVPAPDCSAGQFIGRLLGYAQNLADQNGCLHRVFGEPGTTDYRPERLNFVVDNHGFVQDVKYG